MHEQQQSTTPENVRYELLRPEEIISARDRIPVAYVPLGPLEWHGPHLPIGVDMLHAYSLALEAARRTGGVVLPALPLGSETVLESDRVRDRGFDGQEKIVGMDFPGLSLPSLYIEDSAFGVIVHEIIRALKRQRFKVIVLVNGHGGKFHLITLDRIVAEETESGIVTILHAFHLDPGENKGGHAEKWETGLMMALYGNTVDINLLPPLPEPLKSRDFGILDLPTCFGQPTDDYSVRKNQDPRLASEEEGQESFVKEVEKLAQIVRRALLDFNKTA